MSDFARWSRGPPEPSRASHMSSALKKFEPRPRNENNHFFCFFPASPLLGSGWGRRAAHGRRGTVPEVRGGASGAPRRGGADDRLAGQGGPVPASMPGGDTNRRFGQRRDRPGRAKAARRAHRRLVRRPLLPPVSSSSNPSVPLPHAAQATPASERPVPHGGFLAGTGVAPPTAGRGGRPRIGGSGPGLPMGFPAGGR